MRLALLLLLVGCVPELDESVIVRGRHVIVHADPAVPVCERAVAVADRFIEDSAAMLGVSPRPIDYYLFDGPTNCGVGQYTAASCAIDGAVYANMWIHFHELAHAIDDTFPPALFVEGLAEALSIRSEAARTGALPRATAELALETSIFRVGPVSDNYRIAGDFVRYLLERFGAERYRILATSLLAMSDQITIRRAFERAFDLSLEDVVADWRAADPAASSLIVPVDHVECHDPIAPVAPDTWNVPAVAAEACPTGTTEAGTVFVQYARRYGFEVTEPGLFLIDLIGEAPSHGVVRACAGGVVHASAASPAGTRFMTLPLQRGRHSIELATGVRAWRITRLGDGGELCETAPTFAAPPGEAWRLEVRGPPASWIRIVHDGSRALAVTPAATAPVFVCTDACERRNCRPVNARHPIDLHAGPFEIKLPAGGMADLVSVVVETTD